MTRPAQYLVTVAFGNGDTQVVRVLAYGEAEARTIAIHHVGGLRAVDVQPC